MTILQNCLHEDNFYSSFILCLDIDHMIPLGFSMGVELGLDQLTIKV